MSIASKDKLLVSRLRLGEESHVQSSSGSLTPFGNRQYKKSLENVSKMRKELVENRKEVAATKTEAFAAYGVWSASIPSRTGIMSDRTLPAVVSARTWPRNASMAAALAAVFSDTAGISPAWCCAVKPR